MSDLLRTRIHPAWRASSAFGSSTYRKYASEHSERSGDRVGSGEGLEARRSLRRQVGRGRPSPAHPGSGDCPSEKRRRKPSTHTLELLIRRSEHPESRQIGPPLCSVSAPTAPNPVIGYASSPAPNPLTCGLARGPASRGLALWSATNRVRRVVPGKVVSCAWSTRHENGMLRSMGRLRERLLVVGEGW